MASRSSNTKRSARPKHANVASRASPAKRTNGVKRSNGAHAEHRATYAPSSKTVGATVGSAVSGLAVYFANRAWPGMITPDIAGMVTVVATFALGWVVPPGAREGIVVTDHGRHTGLA